MASDTIAKNLFLAFIMILGLISIIGGIYIVQYIWGVLLGTVFITVQETNTTFNVVQEYFNATNQSYAVLAFDQLVFGTLTIRRDNDTNEYNGSDVVGLANFTIGYTFGNISVNDFLPFNYSNANMSINYSYFRIDEGDINVSKRTRDYLGTAENSFIGVMKKVNSGLNFAASFIIIGVVLMVFAGFIVFGFRKYKGMKGEGGTGRNMGY